jgi:hypothetical protein
MHVYSYDTKQYLSLVLIFIVKAVPLHAMEALGERGV